MTIYVPDVDDKFGDKFSPVANGQRVLDCRTRLRFTSIERARDRYISPTKCHLDMLRKILAFCVAIIGRLKISTQFLQDQQDHTETQNGLI